jgi:serine/threonine protein phosphatase PrpC
VPRSLDQTAQALVYAANAAGGRDNISVLLVQAKPRSVFSAGLSQFLRV